MHRPVQHGTSLAGTCLSAMDDTRRAAETLLTEHSPMLRAWLLHLLASPHDADDVLQEVSLAVLADPGLLLRGSVPGAYLRGIARHLAWRHQRRQRRESPMQDIIEEVWVADDAGQAAPAREEAERAALARCLERLPAHWRRLVDLRYRDGLSAVEIGDRLAKRADGVRAALMRARHALLTCIGRRLADAP